MNQEMKKRAKCFDFICFVVGSFVTSFYIFDFSHKSLGTMVDAVSTAYYYSYESQIGIAVGIALICFGFLRVYWRKSTPYKDKGERGSA